MNIKSQQKQPEAKRYFGYFGVAMWKDIFKMMGFNVVDWIRLAEDMEQWRALMNTAMRRQVP